MPVLLVRHADALPRARWDGDDHDRELSPKGYRQAAALVTVLKGLEPGRVLSSPYLRCTDTVQPLAYALGHPVEREPRLAEGAGRSAVDLVRSVAGHDVVLCSHGDVIPDILAALADEDGLDLGATPRVEKASVWVLDPDGGRFVRASYIPPPDRF